MRVRRPVTGLLVGSALLLAAAVCACAGEDGVVRADGAACPPVAGGDTPTVPPRDVPADVTRDVVAPPDGGGADTAPSPADAGAPRWTLPPCETACDRVVDCAVFRCPGFEWTTAGLLAGECHARCDDDFVAAVAGAADCDALLAGPAADVAVLGERCDEDPCGVSCGRLAACVVAECPALAPALEEPLREDCVRTCDPDDLAWVMSFPTCADLVETVSAADPSFREGCLGVPEECADVADCAPYGARIAGCLVENCGGHADDYEAGLRWAFAEFCRTAEPCASARDVAAIVDPGLTCADPPLSTLGANPPFAGLCQGTDGVDPAALRAACGDVLACAGTAWLPDVDACMALVVLRDDAAALSGCLGAAGGCGELFECFDEGDG